MVVELTGTIAKHPDNGALLFLENGTLVTTFFEENFNGDDVRMELFIDGTLCENRNFEGLLTAMYDDSGENVDETIIVMENDGSIDDIVDLLSSNLGKNIRFLVNS